MISSLFHSVILAHGQASLDTLALSAIEPIGSHSKTESIRRQGLFPNDWNKKITVIFAAMCVVASSRRSARSLHDSREFTLVSILFGSGTIMRALELTRASFTSSHQGWTSTAHWRTLVEHRLCSTPHCGQQQRTRCLLLQSAHTDL